MGLSSLQSVNMILATIGEPPVTALDTGATSPAGWAEEYLGRHRSLILESGDWFQSWEHDITLEVPDNKIEIGAITGTFIYDETVTESTSGATGKLRLIDTGPATDLMYLLAIAGTFTGGELLTGGTSGATTTGVTRSAITEGPIGVDEINWLEVIPYRRQGRRVESVQFALRQDRLYDFDDNTETFDASVKISRIRKLLLAECSGALRQYITMEAAVAFQRFMKRGSIDDAFTREEREETFRRARQFDRRYKSEDANILHLDEIRRLKGGRSGRHDGPINVFSLSGG